MSEKVTLKYTIGDHPEIKDRIVVAFDGTGLDLSNPKHEHFLKVISEVMCSQMYAKANDIPLENVGYKTE